MSWIAIDVVHQADFDRSIAQPPQQRLRISVVNLHAELRVRSAELYLVSEAGKKGPNVLKQPSVMRPRIAWFNSSALMMQVFRVHQNVPGRGYE